MTSKEKYSLINISVKPQISLLYCTSVPQIQRDHFKIPFPFFLLSVYTLTYCKLNKVGACAVIARITSAYQFPTECQGEQPAWKPPLFQGGVLALHEAALWTSVCETIYWNMVCVCVRRSQRLDTLRSLTPSLPMEYREQLKISSTNIWKFVAKIKIRKCQSPFLIHIITLFLLF